MEEFPSSKKDKTIETDFCMLNQTWFPPVRILLSQRALII